MLKDASRALCILYKHLGSDAACLQDASGQLCITQVLHAGDIICEGFVKPLKTDAKAGAPATADKAASDAAPANTEVWSGVLEDQMHVIPERQMQS